MPPPSTFSLLPGLMFLASLQFSNSLPVSQNHRFAVYTPYWSAHGLHGDPYFPHTTYSKPDAKHYRHLDRDTVNTVPIVNADKRSKSAYKTGWTMGGLPFSVLYMNPKTQMSVRSPVPGPMAEPLRAFPGPLDLDIDDLKLQEPPMDRGENFDHEVLAQPLVSAAERPAPTMIPTRRQYSIIPQLFVSYGWGPHGK